MFKIMVFRNIKSYNYKHDRQKNDFSNNIKNNSLDMLALFRNGFMVFFMPVQTVANHPEYDYFDTIAPGDFAIKCFVDSRQYHGQIHGIINAHDLNGDEINNYSMQVEGGYQKGRWLVHDKYSFAKNRDLNNAYSGGCFISSSSDLQLFNELLTADGVQPGDIIKGHLYE